jgi:hypothetical protein|nr:MAG TPA: hypothetical protein [Caudoviricetes sp.]
MGRVIDEDELVEEIKSLKIVLDGKDIFPTAAKDTVLRIISEQPNAYDPDKVVEQLEDYSNVNEAERLGTIPVIELDDAIEIVKGGGVDAD